MERDFCRPACHFDKSNLAKNSAQDIMFLGLLFGSGALGARPAKIRAPSIAGWAIHGESKHRTSLVWKPVSELWPPEILRFEHAVKRRKLGLPVAPRGNRMHGLTP
jgi:hypothetical protein